MRTSCNGCRVLRKGCSDDCIIRPCLLWIKSPDAQANATVFLAKFYGRAGLLNLLNAGPDHLRPAIFQSLLYEACGRVVDPVYGSVGLLSSGQWHHCQLAVETVLKGLPIIQLTNNAPHLRLYDIRHMSRASPMTRPEPEVPPRPRHRRGARSVPNVDDIGDEIDVARNIHQSESMSTDEGSEARAEGSEKIMEETEIGLELTLGFTYDK